MSGLANIAKQQGFSVLGSDMKYSPYVKKVEDLGIEVAIGHNADNIPPDTDLIVYSSAINEQNPERVRGQELGIPEIERSKYLGLLSTHFAQTIGVAGTHGKTTTSAMIAQILKDALLDPSFTIGGSLDEIGGNSYLGNNDDLFIVESCEFRNSFLETNHKIGIITNIEKDHLDFFTGGLSQIIESFHKFGELIPKDGVMIACGDLNDVKLACNGLKCPVIYYGYNTNNNWVTEVVSYNEVGHPTFNLYNKTEDKLELFDTYSLNIPGNHNVLNATAAIITANYLKVEKDVIKESIEKFEGAHRRFEFKGSVNGINVYEDYAHHPTELKVVIESALNHDHNKLWVVFQPHTYSRTFTLFDEFVDAFKDADKIILNDIFSDRETNEKYDIYSEDIAKRIKEKYKKFTIVLEDFEDIVKFLSDNLEENDLVLVAGSQTINEVSQMLIDKLEEIYQ